MATTNPVRPKIQAAALAGTVTAVLIWVLASYVFKDNPLTPEVKEGVPDDLLAFVTLWVPVVVGILAGYVKSDSLSPPAGSGISN